MQKWLIFFLLPMLLVVLVACDGNEDNNDNHAPSIPSATPEPTSVFASQFNGPRLNPDSESGSVDCSLDPDAEGCRVGDAPSNVDDALPLPLTEMEWSGIRLGVPEGFEAQDYGSLLSIEAIDSAAHPGAFQVAFRLSDTAGMERLVNRYEAEQMPHDNDIGDGFTIQNEDRGMIGVWPIANNQYLIVEGVSVPGYWSQYAATFNTIIEELALLEDAS